MCQAGRRLTLDSPAGSVNTANQIAHVHCGGCGITLMCVSCLPALRASPLLTRCCLHRYAYGAQSIKCAVCNFVTQARRRVCGVCLCCNTREALHARTPPIASMHRVQAGRQAKDHQEVRACARGFTATRADS